MPPAATVGQHLLIGQHRGAFGTPVDFTLLAIRQSLLEELEEEPLVPAVVLGQAGGELLRPVVGKAQALHLRLHAGDVVQRPLPRRSLVLDGRIFGGQSERVPPHGMKHVVALHPHVARQGIADGVVAHVSHVQRARGIRQHFENVILLARGGRGFGAIEVGILRPALRPLLLDCPWVIAVGTRGDAAIGDFSLGARLRLRVRLFDIGVGHRCSFDALG